MLFLLLPLLLLMLLQILAVVLDIRDVVASSLETSIYRGGGFVGVSAPVGVGAVVTTAAAFEIPPIIADPTATELPDCVLLRFIAVCGLLGECCDEEEEGEDEHATSLAAALPGNARLPSRSAGCFV